jgi:hypothetical protein
MMVRLLLGGTTLDPLGLLDSGFIDPWSRMRRES